MIYLGDFPTSAVIPYYFSTFAGATGAPITITGLAVGDVKIYKGSSMTERSSTSGITLIDTDGIDIDTRTGIHGFSIDTSDNADSGFYAAGNEYWVIVDTITVDGQTVRFVAFTFSIERSGGILALLKGSNGLANIKTDTAAILVDTGTTLDGRIPAALVSGRMDVSVGAMASGVLTAAAIAADAITAAKVADGTIDAATFAAGAINAAAIATDAITAAKIAADAIGASELAADAVTEIQSGLATAAALATVDDFLDTEIAAIKAKTDNLPTDPADASDVAALVTAVDDFVDTEVAAIKAVTDKLDTALELDGAVYRFTTNALEQAPSGGGSNPMILESGTAQAGGASTITLASGAPSANDSFDLSVVAITAGTGAGQSRQASDYDGTSKVLTVSVAWAIPPDNTSEYILVPGGYDAVTVDGLVTEIWAAQRDDNQTAGSFGEYVYSDVIKISDDASAADSLELAFDGTGLTLTGWVLPWNAAWDAEVQSEAADAITAAGLATAAALDVVDNFLDTEIAAIKAKTDNLPADPADASDIAAAHAALDAKLDAIDNFVDTEIGALQTDVTAIKAKTDNLPSDPADASVVAGLIAAAEAKIDIVDTNVDAIKATTDDLTDIISGVQQLDVNVSHVNDTEIEGDGTDEDPFRALGT